MASGRKVTDDEIDQFTQQAVRDGGCEGEPCNVRAAIVAAVMLAEAKAENAALREALEAASVALDAAVDHIDDPQMRGDIRSAEIAASRAARPPLSQGKESERNAETDRQDYLQERGSPWPRHMEDCSGTK